MFTDFENCFTNKLNGKFILKRSLNNPSHVATLPCDLSLIIMLVSDCRQFSDINVSQGSVMTCLRCGGTVNDDFTVNLLLYLPLKEF